MLSPGNPLAQHEILGFIGAGDMGEVYRARDARLDREVAIKVLPESMHADTEMRGRFEREARAIAALLHPNILAIQERAVIEGGPIAVVELVVDPIRHDQRLAAVPGRLQTPATILS